MARAPETDLRPGRVSPVFIKVAAVCALLTALTTLAVHWLPDLWADATTFESQVQLRHNPIYFGRLWIVLFHCVFVVISMSAVPLLLSGTPRLVALFGFGSFVLFTFVEMLRTSLSIFAVNRTWRAGYEQATDAIKRTSFRDAIDLFSGVNDALFFLFFVAFMAGLFCYGFALLPAKGLDQRVAWLFLLWGLLSLPGFIAAVVGKDSIAAPFAWVSLYFLPIARLLIALWLWNVSRRPELLNPQPSTFNI